MNRRRMLQGLTIAVGSAALGNQAAAAVRSPRGGSVDERLRQLGVTLPTPAVPIATYAPYRIAGDMVFIAGQGPSQEDGARVMGKVGRDLSVEEGAYAARLTAINILAQARAACGGDLDRIRQWVRLTGYVSCVDGFYEQPKVLDGASNLLREVFGEKGLHARAAIGVNALPFNVAVEIEAIFQLRN